MKNAYTFDQLSNEAKMRAFNSSAAQVMFDMYIEDALQDIGLAVEEFNSSIGGIIEHSHVINPFYSAAPSDFFEVVELIGTEATPCDTITGYGKSIAEAYNAVMRENAEKLQSLMEELERAEEASHNTPMGEHDYHIYDVIEIQASIEGIFDDARQKAAQEANEQVEATSYAFESIDDAEPLLSGYYWSGNGEWCLYAI